MGLPAPRVLGPVFRWELVRAARRPLTFWLRVAYAGVLLLALWITLVDPRTPRHRVTLATESFFLSFLTIQLAAVYLLTPGYVGGALAEERDRGSLDFLLVTDLGGLEIVAGKLAARLAQLALVLLTALPFFSLLQLAGGIDGQLVFAAFAIALLTALGLGGVAILCSTFARNPRGAILRAYLVAAGFVVLCGLAAAGRNWVPLLGAGEWFEDAAFVLFDGVEWASPFAIGPTLREAERMGRVPEALGELVRRHALFHGLIAVVCVAWAAARLRGLAASAEGRPRRAPPQRRCTWRHPLLWKEVVVERRLRLRGAALAVLLPLMALSLVPIVPGLVGLLGEGLSWPERLALARYANAWARVVGVAVASVSLLGVVVHAAGSITGERERGTLDGLLTTPLSLRSILLAKLLGSVLSGRWAWPWLLLIWGAGAAAGGLHPLAAVLLAALWLSYAAGLAALGLACSTLCRTTVRATTLALVFLVFPGLLCGWSPPLVLIVATTGGAGVDPIWGGPRRAVNPGLMAVGFGSWLLWIAAGLYFWGQAVARFARLRREEEGAPAEPPGGSA